MKGIDYNITYAPTVKLVSLWLLIVFALSKNLKFHQINIKSAFLNAPLEEEIFLNAPKAVSVPEGHVLKLKKAMYGLKEAPCAGTQPCWIGFYNLDSEDVRQNPVSSGERENFFIFMSMI